MATAKRTLERKSKLVGNYVQKIEQCIIRLWLNSNQASVGGNGKVLLSACDKEDVQMWRPNYRLLQ